MAQTPAPTAPSPSGDAGIVWHGLATRLNVGAPSGARCAAADASALEVAADCSSATGRRLGAQTVLVTNPGATAATQAFVRVLPQRRWAGFSGDSSFSGSTALVTTPDGRALSWGSNWTGLLGRNATDANALQLLPAPVLAQANQAPLGGIVQTQLAGSNAMALTEAGQLWGWGDARYLSQIIVSGVRPAAVSVLRAPTTPSDRVPLSGVVQIASADGPVAAVLEDGSVLGWGYYSGTGVADLQDSPKPVQTDAGQPLTGIRTVAGGWSSIVALGGDGRVWVWGFQLAPDGSNQLRARTMRTVDGAELSGIASLAAGAGFLLALDERGQVWAAGENGRGQLGQGTLAAVPGWAAVLVKNPEGTVPLSNIAMVAAGPAVGLALDRNGAVWSWGNTNVGAIGCGIYRCNTGGNYRALPGPVVAEGGAGQLANVVSIKASYAHSLALKADGTVLIWGNPGAGLGQGSAEAPETYVPIPVKNEAGTGPLRLDPAAYPNLTERAR